MDAAECVAYNDLTVKCLEAHCAGFLESMEDTHMKDLITGGKFSEGQVSNQTKLDLKGVATVSDSVERQYGIAKH